MLKKLYVSLLLLMFLPFSALAADFQWQNEKNEMVSLSSLQGEPLVLHFWASWCPPCRGEMPSLVQWVKQHPDVHVVMVSLDRDREDAQAFFRQHDIKVPLNVGNMRDAFALGVRGLPATLIIGAEGEIKKRRVGDIEWDDKASSDEVLRWL
ncbi:MAG: TlpA disulfide reductase family protein [Ghiorsea sp.]